MLGSVTFPGIFTYNYCNQHTKTMTKKEFKELVSVHKYGRGRNPNNLTAIFFDWKTNDEGNGFKYCVFARNCNAKLMNY